MRSRLHGFSLFVSVALVSAVMLVGAPVSAHALTPVAQPDPAGFHEIDELVSPDALEADFAGESVAVSGDTAVVGAAGGESTPGVAAGCAYVFTRSGPAWTQQAKLAASDASTSDLHVRVSVAVCGDTALMGIDGADTSAAVDAGAVYVFTRSGSTWMQEAKLTASDASASAGFFGRSVAMSGDTAVIGADGERAYVFTRSGSTWGEQAILTASDGVVGDDFGAAVAISSDTVVVGAKDAESTTGIWGGSAYVFTRSGSIWSEQVKLTASDASNLDEFGEAVAISSDTVVIGASMAHGSGSAHVFIRSGSSWSQQAELSASDGDYSDCFGISVAVLGDTALVGAYGHGSPAAGAGSAYAFTRSGSSWSQQCELGSSDPVSADWFGVSVALDGSSAVIGSFGDDTGGANAGSAHVFGMSFVTPEDTPLSVVVSEGVLANDSDPWDDPLTAEQPSDPAHGSVSLASDGSFTYTPDGDWTGTDTFTYQASDGLWYSDPATVTITVTPVSDAPVAHPDPGLAEVVKALASDVAAYDDFGYSVAVSGDTAIIGSRYDDDLGGNSGSAYVFTRSGTTWNQQAKLTASDGAALDCFGSSVALAGDTAVIGAPGPGELMTGSGSAYVFTRSGSTWSEQATLTASDGAAEDCFGWAVVVEGDTAVIGAPADDDMGDDSGSAYVFTRSGSTWTEQDKVTAPDGVSMDHFGSAVALSGDTAVVGSVEDDDMGVDSGSLYVFTGSGSSWTQQAKVTASDGEAGDYFGGRVSLSGETLVVGAYGNDDLGSNAGSAYVLTRTGSTWAEDTVLTAPDGAPGDCFGWAVAVSGDTAVIGAPGDDDRGIDSGSAYAFTRSGRVWTRETKLTGSEGATDDFLGGSVAISGDAAVAGAAGDDYFGGHGSFTGPGSAYVFERVFSTQEDSQLSVGATDGVLANDADGDGDGDSLTATQPSEPSHGSVSLGEDGSLTYTPDADWHGRDTFTYRASDGTSLSVPATVSINVLPDEVRYEQTDSRLAWTGNWSTYSTPVVSAGSFVYSYSTTAAVTVAFDGTGIDWISTKSTIGGKALVSLDGSAPVTVDLYAPTKMNQQAAWGVSGLASGRHTLRISPAGSRNVSSDGAFVWIDAFDVDGELVQAPTRYEQTDLRLVWTGPWTTYAKWLFSGGSYAHSRFTTAGVTVAFNGTGIDWIGSKGTLGGKAAVSLDGSAPVTLDLYSASGLHKQVLWSVSGLTSGRHTLRIMPTNGWYVWIDAFDVTGELVQAPTRYEQTDSRLVWTGPWTTQAKWLLSGGSYAHSRYTTAGVTVAFDGTGIDWIGSKGTPGGKAAVSLDGSTPVTVDLYSASGLHKQVLWSVSGLTSGRHTLRIAPTSGMYVWIDAFDVTGELVQAPNRYEQTDSRIVWTGPWTTYAKWSLSGGSYAQSRFTTATVAVTFNGTGIDWVGTKSSLGGKAIVTVDGTSPVQVDLYSPVSLHKQVIWGVSGLSSGVHTLGITPTATNDAASNGLYVFVDALDVTGVLVDP